MSAEPDFLRRNRMQNEYFIVSKSILPEYYEKVLSARELLRSGKVKEVSEAVRIVGISRSTYYKYKDHIFLASEGDLGKKAVFSMILSHEKGILGKVLNYLSDKGANIITISQNPPIGSRASVVISIDVSTMTGDVASVISELSLLPGVENPQLIDIA